MKIKIILGVFVLFSIVEIDTNAGDPINLDELTTEVEYFNCSGKADGNYEHPTKCSSRYITCHNKKAFERDCPLCKTCPDGRLYYDASLDTCVDAEKAGCGKPPTTTTTTSTTPRPGPEIPAGPCPNDCQQRGYCIWYFRCEGKLTFNEQLQISEGVWVNHTCPKDLFWKPTPNIGSGGQCVYFDDLSPELQVEYKKDPDCFCPCYWEEHETKEGRCQGKYYYWNRVEQNAHDLQRQKLQCPSQLIFNINIETCDHCQNVRGGECC